MLYTERMAMTPTERDEKRRRENEKAGKVRAQASMWVPGDAKPDVSAAMLAAGKRALAKWEREQKKVGPGA